MPSSLNISSRSHARIPLVLALIAIWVSLASSIGCRPSATSDKAPRNTTTTDPAAQDSIVLDTGERLTTSEVAANLQFRQLPNRDGANATTLFTKLDPDETHLDFAHNWTPPAGYQLEIYQSLPGGGVCIGDFDGDDLPDVFLTQPDVGSRLYRNLGGLKFKDVTESAGLGSNADAMGCTFVDIDGDQDLDLYVCNFGSPNRLYINQGDGTFQNRAFEAGLAYNGASVMAAFSDFDQDGDLDVYVVTNRLNPTASIEPYVRNVNGDMYVRKEDRQLADVIKSSDGKTHAFKAGEYDHFYRNNGDGTFTEQTEAAGMSGNHWGLNAIWWDYNRDSKPDLYVSNDFFGPDQLYKNNGDGTFTDVAASVIPHTPWYSMGTDVADLNNDGWLDLMGSDMSGSNHYKQKVSMGDMNSTGWFLTHPTPRQYMRNALYINTGADRFLEVASMAGVANTDWTWSLKFADLDEDGLVDLYVTNGMNRDWVNTDLRSKSDSQSSEEAKRQVWLDSEQRKDPNMAFRNEGNLKLTSMGTKWGLEEQIVSYGAAMADLDRDGDLDIVVNNAQAAPGLYRNNSVRSHRATLRLRANGNAWGIGTTVTIRTEDGTTQTSHITTSQGYMASNEPLMHFGLGNSQTIPQMTVDWPDGTTESFDNLKADRFYAITQSDSTAAATAMVANSPVDAKPVTPLFTKSRILATTRHRETPYDDFARQPLLPLQHSQLGPGQAWADIDGDGDDDFFLGGAAGQAGTLLVNTNGKFQRKPGPWDEDSQSEDMGVLFFDADQDGDCDLYVVSGSVESAADDASLADRLYINNGDGAFVKSEGLIPEFTDSGSCVVAADIDHDGDLDLFIGGRVIPGKYPLTPNSRLLINHNGRFTDATDELAPGLRESGLVTGAVWSDADQDGWLDLLVTHEWGPVKFYRNTQGTLVDQTTMANLHARLGWYNSIVARDLDGDSDIDYVVGNVGLNTKYHATDHHPTQLYCGDFDGSGNLRLIEAEYEHDTLFPVRGKSCSTNAMPFLADKFTKFHDFAVADLPTIYTEEKLSSAHHVVANSLESGVLLNDGSGHFDFKPLPRLAQVAPVFGLVVTELNGDRFPDLCLAHNFYGPQRETGRMDGGVGLVLYGNGDGTFTPQSATDSGITVVGDAKSLTFADVNSDGQPDFVFGMNNASPQVYQATGDSSSFTVRLPATAVGATVTVVYRDQTKQTAEISGGDGYLSQSPTAVQFGDRESVESIDVRWPGGTKSTISPNQIQNGVVSVDMPGSNTAE